MSPVIVLSALAFPAFDPVAVQIGPIAIRWYALAYIAGLMLGWRYVKLLARRSLTASRSSPMCSSPRTRG